MRYRRFLRIIILYSSKEAAEKKDTSKKTADYFRYAN